MALTVLTLGTFDLLHPGHVGLFKRCRQIAGTDGRVVAAVNADEFVARFKRQPVMRTNERLEMVSACKPVDWAIENDGAKQADLIEAVSPDIIVIGSDWARKDYLAQLDITQDWLDEHNIAVCYVPRTGEWSTTEVISRGLGSK